MTFRRSYRTESRRQGRLGSTLERQWSRQLPRRLLQLKPESDGRRTAKRARDVYADDRFESESKRDETCLKQ